MNQGPGQVRPGVGKQGGLLEDLRGQNLGNPRAGHGEQERKGRLVKLCTP